MWMFSPKIADRSAQFQWSVERKPDGISCEQDYYWIGRERLLELRIGENLLNWPLHIARKGRSSPFSFETAFRSALLRWYPDESKERIDRSLDRMYRLYLSDIHSNERRADYTQSKRPLERFNFLVTLNWDETKAVDDFVVPHHAAEIELARVDPRGAVRQAIARVNARRRKEDREDHQHERLIEFATSFGGSRLVTDTARLESHAADATAKTSGKDAKADAHGQ